MPGSILVLACLADAHGNATQILDQSQAQHDRYCPKFTQCQRSDRLVCRYKAGDRFGIDPAVAVRN